MNLHYFIFYYIAAILGLVASPFLFLNCRRNSLADIRFIVIFIISITFLLGAFRLDGVDYAGYISSYLNNYTDIPDLGFQALMFTFNSVGLPFQAMMIFIASITLISLRIAAKYFAISFIPLLTLYFLHLAVVRDFSQLRVGFAVSLAILGLTFSSRLKRGVFYILAISIHFTSLVFILSYEFCRWVVHIESRKSQIMIILCAIVGIFFLSSLVQYFNFIDPRINIYISWESDNYGLPVSQFSSLIFQIFILILAFYCKKSWGQNEKMRLLVFLQIIGVSLFLAFIDISIFAHRLSNVVFSLYPVLLISILPLLRLRVSGYIFNNILSFFVWLLVGIILILRPDSFEILKSISFVDAN